MYYIWGASIIETCLRMRIDLKEIKNEEVHSKEEAQSNKRGKPRQQSESDPYMIYKSKPVPASHFYLRLGQQQLRKSKLWISVVIIVVDTLPKIRFKSCAW